MRGQLPIRHLAGTGPQPEGLGGGFVRGQVPLYDLEGNPGPSPRAAGRGFVRDCAPLHDLLARGPQPREGRGEVP